MLTTRLFSKNIKTQIILPRQWLHVTLNILKSNSSSSDSSSDSDSEYSTTNAIGKKKNIAKDSDHTTSVIHNIKNEKMKTRDYLHGAKEKRKEKQIGKQITKAAEVLTTNVKQNKDEIISTLLDNIFTIQNENKSGELHKFKRNDVSKQLDDRRSGDRSSKTNLEEKAGASVIEMLMTRKNIRRNTDKSRMKYKEKAESSTNQMLLKQQRDIKNKEKELNMKADNVQSRSKVFKVATQKERNMKDNITSNIKMQESLKYSQKAAESTNNIETSKSREADSVIKEFKGQHTWLTDTYKFRKDYQHRERVERDKTFTSEKSKEEKVYDKQKMEELSRVQELAKCQRIFTNDFTKTPPTPELKIWNLCTEKKLQIIMKQYPKNGFEEMIQWTEEGKLWKFPIDNEQGMEEEHNVHFSKHVFLEHHLEKWCPTKGPIRHFMELVCTGLSKNPYMTFEEKYNHIMWYKDYFNGKQELLHKLGLIE